MADWTSLPLDLLNTVALKLEFFEDFVYFCAVCHSWNRASSSIKHQWRTKSVLLLLAENNKDNPDCVRKIFNLNNNKCYNLNLPETFGARCWGSPYGWIAMVDLDFNVRLFNPITKASISFPRLSTLPHLTEYNENSFKDKKEYCDHCLTVILSKLVVIKLSKSANDEFVIMLLHSFTQHVAFATREYESWTSLVTKWVLDVTSTDDYVFALCHDGAIRYWDVNKLFNNPEVVKPMDYSPVWFNTLKLYYPAGWGRPYLVQSGSDLLLVVRDKDEVNNGDDYDFNLVYQTRGIEVYGVNPEDKSWKQIEDLGDLALFVGGNTSMCVNTIGAKSLERNCIYFTDDQHEDWHVVTEFGGHDMGVYDIKCAQIRRFYEGLDTRSKYCPPIWFIPQF